jgi:ATP-dependent Clp protease ATP-binding subunit ClpA
LARRFQKIDVIEPTVDETYQILKGLQSRFEEYHELKYTLDSLRVAAELSDRHMYETLPCTCFINNIYRFVR